MDKNVARDVLMDKNVVFFLLSVDAGCLLRRAATTRRENWAIERHRAFDNTRRKYRALDGKGRRPRSTSTNQRRRGIESPAASPGARTRPRRRSRCRG